MGILNFFKRRSIRTNIMGSFVILSLLFIGGIGGLSYLLFKRAGDQTINNSINALEEQIKENILITAEKNAQIIFEKLSSAEAMVQYMATELEYLFSDNNRYGYRESYYDYWFDHNLSDQSLAPADVHWDDAYQVDLSWDYASYYFSGSDSSDYLPKTNLQNKTLKTVASMDYVFQNIHNNAPELRWLYITFKLLSIDLFINYPGSILAGNDSMRLLDPYLPHNEYWYQTVYSGDGEIVFTEPYFDEIDGVPLVTIGRKTEYPNYTDLAVICGDISISDMVNKILNIKILDTGYASLIMSNGLVVAHPEAIPDPETLEFSYINQIEINSNGTSALTANQITDITSGNKGILRYIRDGQERFLAYQPVGKGDYISLIILPVDEALEGIQPVEERMNNAITNNLSMIWIIVGVSLAIGITIGLILTAYITRPFTHLIKVARSLSTRRARKDIMDGLMLEIDPKLLKSQDELGELTRAFKSMLDSVQQSEREKNQ